MEPNRWKEFLVDCWNLLIGDWWRSDGVVVMVPPVRSQDALAFEAALNNTATQRLVTSEPRESSDRGFMQGNVPEVHPAQQYFSRHKTGYENLWYADWLEVIALIVVLGLALTVGLVKLVRRG